MRFRSLLALFAALVLFVGACGGDDDDSADSADKSSDSGDDGSDSGDDGDSDLGIPDDVDLGECDFMADFAADMAANSQNPMAMFEGDGLSGMAESIENLADGAPSEISDDLEVLADGFRQIADAMADIDIDFSDPANIDPAAMEEASQAMAGLSSGEFAEASENITVWMEDACPELAALSTDTP